MVYVFLIFLIRYFEKKSADNKNKTHKFPSMQRFKPFNQSLLNTGPEVIKLFSCSTQRSTKFILLINVKMPTIVGILTFISRINTSSESLKAKKIYIFQHFCFYEQLKFCAQLS